MTTRLLPIAGVLVFVSAAVHLALGVAGLAGGSALLPASHLLGGLAALALLGAIATDRVPPAVTHAAGAGVMVPFVLAYVDVPVFGIAESTLGIESSHDPGVGAVDHTHDGEAGHSHGHDGHGQEHSHDDHGHEHAEDGALITLAEGLRGDVYALISKAAEAGAAVLFAVLLVLDP